MEIWKLKRDSCTAGIKEIVVFQKLYELSQMLPSQEPWQMLNEGMPDNYDRGLAVCFDTNGKYVGIRTLNRSSGVLYRPGPSSNSGPFTPSVKISDKLEKKVQWMFAATRKVTDIPVQMFNDLKVQKVQGFCFVSSASSSAKDL